MSPGSRLAAFMGTSKTVDVIGQQITDQVNTICIASFECAQMGCRSHREGGQCHCRTSIRSG